MSVAQEIRSRIEMVKKVFTEKKKLFTGKMNLELKKRIMKCLGWSVALYSTETWFGKWRWFCCTQTSSWGQRHGDREEGVKNLLYSRRLLLIMTSGQSLGNHGHVPINLQSFHLFTIVCPHRHRAKALSDDARLTSVCLYVCLSRTSDLSREQRGLGILKLARRWLGHHFKGEKVKCQLAGGGAYCGGLPHSLLLLMCLSAA